ncbi:hypothetical protein HDU79_000059 [Rhizoclosmatium sp. JEL0117]|nr:hypothetical protein HDU79_000059 [Rhizoclosmatium sp. JEL0117]
MDILSNKAEELCRAFLDSKNLDEFADAAQTLAWSYFRLKDTRQSCELVPSVRDRIQTAVSRVKRKRDEGIASTATPSSNNVQISLTGPQLDARIKDGIQKKRAIVDESNRNEFVAHKDPESTSARVDAVEINRKVQMKIDLVVNEDRPLDRLTSRDGHGSSDSTSHLSTKLISVSHLQGRLADIEKHLRIKFDPNSSFGIHQRVKILEEAIIQLEEKYPCWSAVHFDHSTKEHSMDPFGPSVWTNVALQGPQDTVVQNRYVQSGSTTQPTVESNNTRHMDKSYSEIDSDSINKRIEELKQKLLKK